VTAEPRVVFELRQPGGGEAVRLSPLGRFLAEANEGEDAGAATIRAEGALLAEPVQDATLLAARLKEALSESGLFYESHLGLWAAGGMKLHEILKEPQGRLSRGSAAAGPAGSSRAPGAAGSAHGDGDQQPAGSIADERTMPQVKNQLALLNGGVLTWKGEAWPGQELELTVTEGGREGEEAAVEATLSLEMPQLGVVRARLHLGAEGLSLQFETESAETRALLAQGADDLRAASSAHGVQICRMVVRHGEE
jgi:hypothetical protein